MAQQRTYLGPADTLEVDGKIYRRGEPVQMDEVRVRHLEMFGHHFSDTNPQDARERSAAYSSALAGNLWPDQMLPRDDQGNVVDEADYAHKQSPAPTPAEAAAQAVQALDNKPAE